MGTSLSTIRAQILGRMVDLFGWPTVIVGIDPNGKPAPFGIGSSTYSSVTLTSDATAPSDGDTVTIGAKVYTYKTTLTPTEGEVLIGISAAVALDNIKAAVNHTGTPNTDYKCALVHPTVTATTNTNTTQVFVAITPGPVGNSIVSTEASSHLSFGSATLTGGLNAFMRVDSSVNNGSYETVAASQTGQVLGGAGATGDFVDSVTIIPASTSPGSVALIDGVTSITIFAGGASSVADLVPFTIQVRLTSATGVWSVTTGLNVSAIFSGRFT